MRVWVKCDKCGKAFEAEERVRADICPHCMSFVNIEKPRISCRGKNLEPAGREENVNFGGNASAERICLEEKRAAAGGIKNRFQKFKRRAKIDETLRLSYESTIRDEELLGEVSERTSEQIAAIDLISGYLRA